VENLLLVHYTALRAFVRERERQQARRLSLQSGHHEGVTMVDELEGHPKALAAVLLLATTAVWGATFVVVKDAIATTGVIDFLSWRFLIAGMLLAAARPRALVRLGWRGWSHGAALGLALAGGYVLQTYGLRYTSAAMSGFLTGLQVVFVPLLTWLVLRRRPAPAVWVATLLATAGLAVISLGKLSFGTGELMTIACAGAFALQIIGLGRWATGRNAYGLATVQLLTVAACSLLAGLPRGPLLPRGAGPWGAIVLTAVMATAGAFVVQAWAQTRLSTAQATIVLSMEPAFAALAAWVAGEKLGWSVVVGGALLIFAMLSVELLPKHAIDKPVAGTKLGQARLVEVGVGRAGVGRAGVGRGTVAEELGCHEDVPSRGAQEPAGAART